MPAGWDKYAILFEPIDIGPKTLRNRFYQVPHCAGFGSEKPYSQAAFRATKAEGGWGAVCTEYCSIHPESDDVHRVSARLWDEDDVRNLSLMCEEVHAHGALAGVQLWYGGAHAPCLESRIPPRAPSQVPSEAEYMVTAQSMDRDDIYTLQRYYIEAAKRAEEAGFDIVYVYGGHSQGPSQFLAPFYNKRTDEYGGSFENRARHWRETIEKVRDAIGESCAIAVRITVDMFMGDDGVLLERDALPFVELCDDIVDLWDVTIGSFEWGEDATPSRFYKSGRHLPWQSAVKNVTKKPVVGVGRFTDPDLMVEVIASGQLDIIGAARPSISDPFLPRKIEERRFEDIRECIGCNVCISRWEIGGPPLVCTQNATAGEEYRRGWHPEKFDRAENADNDVLVIGAGPAGMECARVLGERGMRRVHLVDAEEQLGGSMRWIPELPGLGEWARVVNDRQIQLDKLRNVEFIPNTTLTVEGVRQYGATIVVVATGSHWATDGLNGGSHAPIPGADASLPTILTPEQIMVEHKEIPGHSVVIIDGDGYFMAISLAEKLAIEGKKVTVITHLGHVAPYMHFTLEAPNMHRKMHRLGVELAPSHQAARIEPEAVVSTAVFDEARREHTWPADAVVLVTQRLSNESLYRRLRSEIGLEALQDDGITGVFRIGDCVAPRLVADCIFDGHRLGREIDAAEPDVPRPFLRERKVVELAGVEG
jgi:dimethylamine/trimethylamine dehydrogenase